MTTDGDLAVDVSNLLDDPEIGTVLRGAGFRAGKDPGHWLGSGDVAIDLMVVPHQSGRTKKAARAAKLPPHDPRTARIARGLEPALVDHDRIILTAFEPADGRTCTVQIAGPAALLTAKAIKIAERLEQAETQPDRLKGKDALDAFRLLRAVDTEDLLSGFSLHWGDGHAEQVSREAVEVLRQHASTARGAIPALAAAAAGDDPTIAPAFAALVAELLSALD